MSYSTRAAWDAGVDKELAWWRNFLAHGRELYPEEFNFRFDPDTLLQQEIARELPPDVPISDLMILDCAAGPATTLGKMHKGERLRISAVDALAPYYDDMVRETGALAPVRTVAGEIEHLDRLFAPETFHLTYMRFALDHCYHPLGAVRQMVRVTHRSGAVMIEHYRDAAQTEFQGLKQWRLDPQAGDLVISNETHSFSLREIVPECSVRVNFSPTWLTAVVRQRPTSSEVGSGQ